MGKQHGYEGRFRRIVARKSMGRKLDLEFFGTLRQILQVGWVDGGQLDHAFEPFQFRIKLEELRVIYDLVA